MGAGRGAAKARSGLVRALHGYEGREGTSRGWSQGGVAKVYRRILVSAGTVQKEERTSTGKSCRAVIKKGMSKEAAKSELARLDNEAERDLKISKVVQCRVRYFTDGAVIGSKKFVNEAFSAGRERFGATRKD